MLYDWQRELQSLSDRGSLLERTSSSNDKSKSDNRSSNDKSDRSGKSRQLDGYTVSYHSPSVCQLINHPEANKSGLARNHTRSARSSFLKIIYQIEEFPYLSDV